MEWLNRVKVADESGKLITLGAYINQVVMASKGDMAALEAGIQQVQDAAVNAGYFFATFSLTPPGKAKKDAGKAILHVDSGYVAERNITFVETSGRAVKQPTGRYFSKEQIERRFPSVAPGMPFTYTALHQDFQEANLHPDLTISPHLRMMNPADAKDADDARRNVGVDLNVHEKLPLHGVLGFDNYGTDLTDNWMGRLTLQHLNLTRADDILTLNAQTALDWGALYGLAASYYRPFYWGNGGGWTVYGGWSDVESEDVLPGLDVKGHGYFAGIQGTLNIVDNHRRRLSVSAGVIHRYVKDKIKFEGETMPLGDVTLMPFSLAMQYTDKTVDAANGFNFFAVEGLANFGDFLGTSDDDEMASQRVGAEADFMMVRAQAIRLQRLGSFTAVRPWVLFLRVNAQAADGPLIPAEQLGLGGSDDVRGYESREYLGDDGATASVELRTPTWAGPLSHMGDRFDMATKSQPGYLPYDRIQGVLFFDAGYASFQDPIPGDEEDKTLTSVGLGIRYAMSEYMQLKFDWGFPLKETEDSSHGGRGYLNVQFLF